MKFHIQRSTWVLLMLMWPQWLHSQSLQQLIATSLDSHPSVRAQEAQVRASQSDIELAQQQFLPSFNLSWEKAQSRSHADNAYASGQSVALARLQQPLWTGGRLTANLDKTRAQHRLAIAQLSETQIQLGLRIVQAYGEWWAAEHKHQALENSLAIHTELKRQISHRAQQGASAQGEVTLSTARLEQLRAEVQNTRTQGAVALTRLQELSSQGLSISSLKASYTPAPVIDTLFEEALHAQAIEQAPILERLKAQQAIVVHEREEKAATRWPEIYVRAEHQAGSADTPQAFSGNRVFIGLTASTGAGLSLSKQMDSLLQRERAIEAEVEAAHRNLREQIQTEVLWLRASQDRITSLALHVQASQSIQEAYARQFNAGRKTWIDVMNAARELTQAHVQIAEAQAMALTAAWRLHILTRGLEKPATSP
ncbi:TolC family protein [Limnohabitans sp.]|uniref:TolC family protein n=1 Tax=Limnohabitans sp. TaxID=1907725 RepID=UPI00311E647A